MSSAVLPSTDRSSPRSGVFSFPEVVNEITARIVAGGVVAISVVALATGARWLIAVIAYGFVARVLSGPTLSPLGQLATRVITPALPARPRPVPGAPKRFAQAIGVCFSVSAAILALAFDAQTAADVLLGVLVLAATLESVFGYCLGCKAFALLSAAGVIPAEVCERCSNIAGAQQSNERNLQDQSY